jgi:protein-L-isoaspartate(D-aspartate) O-methyltransferase
MDQPASLSDLPADCRRRARMVRDQLADCGDQRVLAAMAALPRHLFVPAEGRGAAYDDAPLAIGCGQTISQPRMVARMLTLLALRPGMQVLDVGAGSGYAAALLWRLTAPGGRVLAVERQGTLAATARPLLANLAPGVELVHGDALALASGRFDAIHVACACPGLPAQLAAHLAPDGILVAPVAEADGRQHLVRWRAGGAPEALDDVLFVPALPGVVAE